jgi:hypothetical protein
MTIETEVAALTTATNSLVSAVLTQQTAVTSAVSNFADTTSTVTNDLNFVDNVRDANKPISIATQTALDAKQVNLVSGSNISTINGVSILSGTPLVVERGATSLVSLAYEDRATLKSDPAGGNPPNIVDDSVVVEGLGMFMWVDTQIEPDDDETCFSTPSTGQWLLVTPAFDLIEAYELVEDAYVDEFIEDQLSAKA